MKRWGCFFSLSAQRVVLQRMAELNFITEDEAARAAFRVEDMGEGEG